MRPRGSGWATMNCVPSTPARNPTSVFASPPMPMTGLATRASWMRPATAPVMSPLAGPDVEVEVLQHPPAAGIVEPDIDEGDGAAQADQRPGVGRVRHLVRHGIPARLEEIVGSDVPIAELLLSRAADIWESQLRTSLAPLSESRKRALMTLVQGETENLVSFHADASPSSPRALELALTTVLRRKGRVLDSLTEAQRTLRDHLTPPLRHQLDHRAPYLLCLTVMTAALAIVVTSPRIRGLRA